MIELKAGDYRLTLDPAHGGSVAAFSFGGLPLMRATCGPSILDTASFPLVPFSGRIAHGRFTAGAHDVMLAPNLPGADHPHTLHGFGWLTEWTAISHDNGHAELEHVYPGGAWPWRYRAVQSFGLAPDGLTMRLTLQNLGDAPMPAGLGFHPYFPRTPDATYRGLHRGEWQNSPDCLPMTLKEKAQPADWWDGRPVGSRAVDTVYTGREGALSIQWPGRGLALEMTPSDNLGFTVVYVPEGKDFFCVEPVSHMADAVNRPGADTGLAWLAPAASISVQIMLRASAL
jgi:aldose 1-epimerase